jgi:phosphatidylglycerol:prolipoprotein diacylglycerol transferase
MHYSFYLRLGPLRLHPHWIFETLAYTFAFQVYLALRRRHGDAIDLSSRWWVIAAAAMGAVLGSKLLYWLEDPRLTLAHWNDPGFLMSGKTIVGALIGGLFAVELIKIRLGVARHTGDLFAIPLCVGIAIGRIGCFLTGIEDHTSGSPTSLPWGVNFGDGILRHPTQIYEILFVLTLAVFLFKVSRSPFPEGDLFKIFMSAYFAFRLTIDFLKSDIRILFGLSSIQWACLAMLLYYSRDILRWARALVKPASTVAVGALSRPEESP